MSLISVEVLSSTSGEWEVTGEPIKSSGWYGQTIGLHTVALSFFDFTGGVILEGTLESEPQEEDWFEIELNGLTNPLENQENTIAFTFEGNYTYVRARLSRTEFGYVPSTDPGWNVDEYFGYIRSILMNF